MKTLLIIAALAFAASAQDTRSQYVTVRETTLSSSTEKITIQQPTSGAIVVIFDYAKVYCTVDTTITLSVEGTAASTTALTPTPLNSSSAAKALGFRSSNVGSGTTIDTYFVAANSTFTIDLSHFYLAADGTAHNLSLGTSSITGTCRISIKHYEGGF